MAMAEHYKVLWSVLLVSCAVVTFKEFFAHSDSGHVKKEIPVTRAVTNKFLGPLLKFQYCHSCGYHKAFTEYANIIQEKYPLLVIQGENYNPSPHCVFLARLLYYVKMVILVGVLLRVNIVPFVATQPNWWTWCVDNRLYTCVVIFFLGNSVENMLMSTGAFEIMFNDVPVWSKLETGRIPQPPELFQIIDNTLQFQTKVEFRPGVLK